MPTVSGWNFRFIFASSPGLSIMSLGAVINGLIFPSISNTVFASTILLFLNSRNFVELLDGGSLPKLTASESPETPIGVAVEFV